MKHLKLRTTYTTNFHLIDKIICFIRGHTQHHSLNSNNMFCCQCGKTLKVDDRVTGFDI